MAINLQEKYDQERKRRLNDKGLGQYLNKTQSAEYILHEDPWVAEGTPVPRPGMCYPAQKLVASHFTIVFSL